MNSKTYPCTDKPANKCVSADSQPPSNVAFSGTVREDDDAYAMHASAHTSQLAGSDAMAYPEQSGMHVHNASIGTDGGRSGLGVDNLHGDAMVDVDIYADVEATVSDENLPSFCPSTGQDNCRSAETQLVSATFPLLPSHPPTGTSTHTRVHMTPLGPPPSSNTLQIAQPVPFATNTDSPMDISKTPEHSPNLPLHPPLAPTILQPDDQQLSETPPCNIPSSATAIASALLETAATASHSSSPPNVDLSFDGLEPIQAQSRRGAVAEANHESTSALFCEASAANNLRCSPTAAASAGAAAASAPTSTNLTSDSNSNIIIPNTLRVKNSAITPPSPHDVVAIDVDADVIAIDSNATPINNPTEANKNDGTITLTNDVVDDDRDAEDVEDDKIEIVREVRNATVQAWRYTLCTAATTAHTALSAAEGEGCLHVSEAVCDRRAARVLVRAATAMGATAVVKASSGEPVSLDDAAEDNDHVEGKDNNGASSKSTREVTAVAVKAGTAVGTEVVGAGGLLIESDGAVRKDGTETATETDGIVDVDALSDDLTKTEEYVVVMRMSTGQLVEVSNRALRRIVSRAVYEEFAGRVFRLRHSVIVSDDDDDINNINGAGGNSFERRKSYRRRRYFDSARGRGGGRGRGRGGRQYGGRGGRGRGGRAGTLSLVPETVAAAAAAALAAGGLTKKEERAMRVLTKGWLRHNQENNEGVPPRSRKRVRFAVETDNSSEGAAASQGNFGGASGILTGMVKAVDEDAIESGVGNGEESKYGMKRRLRPERFTDAPNAITGASRGPGSSTSVAGSNDGEERCSLEPVVLTRAGRRRLMREEEHTCEDNVNSVQDVDVEDKRNLGGAGDGADAIVVEDNDATDMISTSVDVNVLKAVNGDDNDVGGQQAGGMGNMVEKRVPPASLTATNRGFGLLVRLGWRQGDGLGAGANGVKEPVEAHARRRRTGVGGS